MKEGIFWLYLATLMLPGQVILIPVFTIMKQMNLLNTYPALFLVIWMPSSLPDAPVYGRYTGRID